MDKSGTFLDQISEHFGSSSQNVLKSDLKNPGFVCHIWGQSDPFLAQFWASLMSARDVEEFLLGIDTRVRPQQVRDRPKFAQGENNWTNTIIEYYFTQHSNGGVQGCQIGNDLSKILTTIYYILIYFIKVLIIRGSDF